MLFVLHSQGTLQVNVVLEFFALEVGLAGVIVAMIGSHIAITSSGVEDGDTVEVSYTESEFGNQATALSIIVDKSKLEASGSGHQGL